MVEMGVGWLKDLGEQQLVLFDVLVWLSPAMLRNLRVNQNGEKVQINPKTQVPKTGTWGTLAAMLPRDVCST